MITTDKGKDKEAVRSYPPYFETAKVKVYQTKTGKGYKSTKKLINLSVKSEFEDLADVIVLSEDEFKKLLEDPETPSRAEFETLQNEKREHLRKLADLEQQVTTLEAENKQLNKKIIDILEERDSQAQELRDNLEDLRASNTKLENINKSLELEYNELNQINQNNIKNILNNSPLIIEEVANGILALANKEMKERGVLARLRNDNLQINDSEVKENATKKLDNQINKSKYYLEG